MRNPRFAIVTGCIVPRDAVSNIVLQQADALCRPGVIGERRTSVRLYCHGSPLHDSRIKEVRDADALLSDPYIQSADAVLFHFAIRYAAFDAIHKISRLSRVMVYYHGVTPPSVCRGDDRAITTESYRQAHGMAASDQVLVTSEHLVPEVLGYGVPGERIHRVPPAVAVNPVPRGRDDETFRVLYVGRFVPAKGVQHLLEAFARLAPDHADMALTLAGSRTFSDQKYLAELQSRASDPRLAGRVTFAFDEPSHRLAELYASADLFVLPSYHEGFGVPIIEALAAGCQVIVTRAGAAPETLAGHGQVVPVGDESAIRAAIQRSREAWASGRSVTDQGAIPRETFQQMASDYALSFSREAFEDSFRAAVLADCHSVMGKQPGLGMIGTGVHAKHINLLRAQGLVA